MSSKALFSGIAGLILAAYLAAVIVHRNVPLLVSGLAQEVGFLRWGLAVLIWQALRLLTSGNTRALMDATGTVAVATAFIIGMGRNSERLGALQSGIHKLLTGD